MNQSFALDFGGGGGGGVRIIYNSLNKNSNKSSRIN
jgi:hypothetical protein